MHWSEKIARNLIDRNPGKEEYVCAAGISPSGSVHIGNFRDIATSLFVCKALRKLGKKAKLLFSWDEFDRLRKVPVNVAKVTTGFEQYIGKPYTDVPDPFGCCENYARHFENEFEQALKQFGIEVDFRYQTARYRSGQYAEYVMLALRKRKEIFDILDSFRTQESTPEEREHYCPVSIYCPVCGKDTTTVTAIADDCRSAEYTCKCGHSGHFDFTKDFNCKLAWKVDWPMRWLYEKVDFEPGGKDHASPSGSYQTSRVIAKEIFGFEAPMFQGYEFIGIKGATGKMSGSTGLNLTPETLLKLYQPEVILWLYSKSDPTKSFDFCFDDEILRQYFEFDKMYDAFVKGTDDEYVRSIMELVVDPAKPIKTVPMAQLVSLGSVVDFNPEVLETVFRKIGTPYAKEEFLPRLSLARYWLEVCAPQNMNTLRTEPDRAFFESLPPAEQQAVRILHDYIAGGGYTLDELMAFLYDIPRQVSPGLEEKELKKQQGKFFQNVYTLLISKTKGPRLYLFLYAIEPEKYLKLLEF